MRIGVCGVLLGALLWSASAGAVTSGSSDTGDPAVVGIVDATGRLVCTGSVVAPHAVLTAAHCTQPSLKGARVVFGSSAGTPSASIAVSDAIADPSFDPATLADDVAILVLSSSSPTSPLPMAQMAPAASFVGSQVAIVGYGETSGGAGDTGTKRRGTATVSALNAQTFDVVPGPSQPCEGDSGGPALATVGGNDSVVGVVSHGDGACTQQAIYTRVDAYESFVQGAITSVDPGTGAPGQPCLYPERCVGGAGECLAASDDAAVQYCSKTCAADGDCPSGMKCSSSQCRYPTPTPGAIGSACKSDGDCVRGQCTTTGVCSVRCDPAMASPCPSGFSCDDIEGGVDFFCFASPSAPPAISGGCTLGGDGSTGEGTLACLATVLVGAVFGRRRPRSRRR